MKPPMQTYGCKTKSCHYYHPFGGGSHCTRPDTKTRLCEIRRKLTRKEFEEEQKGKGSK